MRKLHENTLHITRCSINMRFRQCVINTKNVFPFYFLGPSSDQVKYYMWQCFENLIYFMCSMHLDILKSCLINTGGRWGKNRYEIRLSHCPHFRAQGLGQPCPRWACVCFKKEEESPPALTTEQAVSSWDSSECATSSSRSELLGIEVWLKLVWEAF